MRLYLLYIFLAFASLTASAQADRQHIRGGNRLYKAKQWAQAEVEYRKALAANAQNPQALYNLGCALMMQQKDSAAIVQYQKAAQAETNKLRRSRSYHNIGVICQNLKMYGDAIKAYLQATEQAEPAEPGPAAEQGQRPEAGQERTAGQTAEQG